MEMRISIARKAGNVALAAILTLGSASAVDVRAYADQAQSDGVQVSDNDLETGSEEGVEAGASSSDDRDSESQDAGSDDRSAVDQGMGTAQIRDVGQLSDQALAGDRESDDAQAEATDQSAFEQYLTDRSPTGASVGWGSLYCDESYDGSSLSLLVNGQEQTFDHGFWAHADSSIYYNDIQEYGYERFEAVVGLSHTARVSGKSAEVVFKVVADGETIWQSGVMTEKSDAVPVSLDIADCKVIQLVAEAVNKSAHPNNHAVWADAKFTKQQAAPWLSVSPKEFSNPEQVTAANILEGTFARTLSGPVGETDAPVTGSDGTLRNGKEGNDLSDAITYTTDYVEGQTGSFSITYSVKDAQGLTRSRTVGMTVRGEEVVRTDADLDYLTMPFASFLYAGRDYFDEQGKAAFDLSVETLLDFGNNVDSYQLVDYWGEAWKVTINLQEHGIYMSTADAGYLCSTIMDCEPRTFHVKDWGTQVTSKDGIAETVTYYVAPKYGEKDESGQVYYHNRLLQTEVNASRFLSNAQGGMTDSQRLRAVLSPYASWIRYGGGGQVMDEALAGGQAVCGGNARGSIYLSQRMGIKAYWVRTDSHAWSNVKLNRDDSGISGTNGKYYRIDLLAGTSCFLSIDAEHQGFHGHHKEIYFNRMKGYPDMVTESYPYAWTAWPSVTLDVEDSWVVLAPEDAATFDASKLIISASSIYDGDLRGSVSVDYGDLRANAEGSFDDGYYPIVYAVSDTRGNSATATVNVQVVGGDVVEANAENCARNVNSTFLPNAEGSLPSLWNGSGEVVYGYGIAQNDGGKAVTYSVDRGNGVRLTCLDAWIGLHRSTRDSEWGYNGKVRFLVKATVPAGEDGIEEKVLYTSADMTRYTVQEHVLVKIPDDAISVTLTSESLGSGNGHARWGNPRFFTSAILDEVPVAPVISGVEDGAVYSASVTPSVSGASKTTLYRKNLPVTIDPDTGLTIDGSSGVQADAFSSRAAAVSSDWGDEIEGYRAGDTIEDEGVYTLVAANEYNQRAVVSFTIDRSGTPDEPEDPGTPDEPEDPGTPDEPEGPSIPDTVDIPIVSFPQMTVGEDGPFAVSVQGPKDAFYSYEVADESVLVIGSDGSIEPRKAGSTTVRVVMRFEGVAYGPYDFTATVDPRALKLKVHDASMNAGDYLPDFACEIVEGSLLEGDSLDGIVYQVADDKGNGADGSIPGSYYITVRTMALGSNYNIESVPGVLVVAQSGMDAVASESGTSDFGEGVESKDGSMRNDPAVLASTGDGTIQIAVAACLAMLGSVAACVFVRRLYRRNG